MSNPRYSDERIERIAILAEDKGKYAAWLCETKQDLRRHFQDTLKSIAVWEGELSKDDKLIASSHYSEALDRELKKRRSG